MRKEIIRHRLFALLGAVISVVVSALLLPAVATWFDSDLWRLSIAAMMISIPAAGVWSAYTILTSKLDSFFASLIRNRLRVVNSRDE